MSFVVKMLNLQVMLFLLMAIGIIMKKVGIITPENRKSFSGLLLNVVLPCNIIHSFLGDIEIS